MPKISNVTISLALGGAALTLALTAILNRGLAKKAERDNPPEGAFVEIDGVRLHYVEHGSGTPVVLLHGNGSMIQDFKSSGLSSLVAQNHRVILFDRPGYGYSERPRTTIWTPATQAELLNKALVQLGVSDAVVLGHSWGAGVAVEMALGHPETVAAVVLASGYFYPSVRADVAIMSSPAIPVLGDLMRFTVSPILGRLMWPLAVRKIFTPSPVPRKFDGFPREMAVRPSQIRAGAAEAALMIPGAFALLDRYKDLKMPVVIIAGDDDQIVDIDAQSARLHQEIAQSTFHRIPHAGHMIQQSATKDVKAAIDEAAAAIAAEHRPAVQARAA